MRGERQTQFGLHYQTDSPFQVMRDFIRDGKLIMISDWVVRNKWQIGFAANASSEDGKTAPAPTKTGNSIDLFDQNESTGHGKMRAKLLVCFTQHATFNRIFLVSGFHSHLNKIVMTMQEPFAAEPTPLFLNHIIDPTKETAQMQKQQYFTGGTFLIRHNFSSGTRSLFVIYTFNCFFCGTICFLCPIPEQVESRDWHLNNALVVFVLESLLVLNKHFLFGMGRI